MTAHMKPTLGEAIRSVLTQTRQDFALVIVDSGAWVRKKDDVSRKIQEDYLTYVIDPRIEWVFTGERPNMGKEVCMVSHVFNQAYEVGLLRGKYICTFYDDDLYYPDFFEKMAGYLDEHPDSSIVRCSEQWTVLKDGAQEDIKVLRADRVLSRDENMDCVVDGMQVMFRKQVLDDLKQAFWKEPLMDPRPEECRHSDGLFFNKMRGVIKQMDYIDEILCRHRFTPHSTFTPSNAL